MRMRKTLRPAIIGPFGPAQLACLRSWGRLDLCPIFIRVDEGAPAVYPSLKLGAYRRFRSSELKTCAGLAELLKFLETERVSGITCVGEDLAKWLNGLQNRVPAATKIWVPENRVIEFLLSKPSQIEFARDVGLAVLPTCRVDRSCLKVPNTVQFPVVARPAGSGIVSPDFKAKFIESQEHLETFIGAFERLEEPLILQPFVSGPNLVVHGYRGRDGSIMDHIGFLGERKFEGLALTIRHFALPEDLKNKCAEFCNRLGIVGCYHFDFVIDGKSGMPYFLELNGRFGGTTAKVLACGYDEPASLLVAHGELDPDVLRRPISDATCASRAALFKYLTHIAAGRISPLDYPAQSTWKAVADVGLGVIAWRDDIISCRDFASAIAYFAQFTLDKLRPRARRKAA
jgi:predicted ATP-grasp superfamily ATP-dependent carboligase